MTKRLNHGGHAHQYSHFTRLPDAHDRCLDYVDRIAPKLVQDRFHMSEAAYCFGRGDEHLPLTPAKVLFVDACLRQVGTFTVVLTTDPASLAERFAKRGDHMYDERVIMRANDAFHMIAFDEFESYDFDIGVHIHLEGPNCYVTESQENEILTRYLERYTSTLEIMERAKGQCRPRASF